jgi:membrane glycosyltransferase
LSVAAIRAKVRRLSERLYLALIYPRQRKAARPKPAPKPVKAAPGPYPEWVPPEHRLAMPAQSLRSGRLARLAGEGGAGRRVFLLLGSGVITGAAAAVTAILFAPGGLSVVDVVAFSLFVVLFAWVAFGFVSAVGGFWVCWRRGEGPATTQPVILSRTALLAPTYNEDPGRILAAVQAMHEDLEGLGVAALYDFFVLSDTRDEAIAREEAVGVLRLRARLGPEARIFYRRREKNTDRKAGNIAEWVERFGGAYESMLILDADSLMSGETILQLTARMEHDPGLGLLQTSPTIINAETPFARLQQFASRAYGPMLAAGQDWWSGAEGNYWGHNAIIRTRAFAERAGLPHLPGPRPFGGHIMSHDFVEAALLRRGGWKIRLAADLEGSYEETPPTILDMAIRDRRWCQGNLQHLGVVGAAGLHWISRLHLIRGVLSYATSPLWLFLLIAGAGVWMEQGGASAVMGADAAAWLFGLTMVLLIAPKLMAAALALRSGGVRRAFGGGVRFVAGVVLEVVLSALVAPVLMLMQSVSVLQVLVGRDAGWATQQRDPGRLSRREAWRIHRAHMGIGGVAAALVFALDPVMFWWSCPVYLGLIFSAPLALLLSQPELGDLLGLFRTPEERRPPPVVVRAAQLRAAYDREAPIRAAIERRLREPALVYGFRAIHTQPRRYALAS